MKRKMMVVLLILISFLGIGIGYFAYRNLHYDKANLRQIQQAGIVEKQATLPDGSVINYGEGPNHGQPLLLIHGQQVSWQDYAKVLGELSKHFHVYAVDCYGHGGSSKNPAKYTALANSQDFIWFIQNVIQQPVLISGHSSGGLLATLVAAEAPKWVLGLLIEDAPFFSTEPNRAPSTYSWLSFKDMHDFLESGEKNYTAYFLEHTYLRALFGRENFNKIVSQPALNYMKNHPGQIPRIWYYPPEWQVNTIYDLTANLQDGTGNYDLRFGNAFYDFSWFEGFHQKETLKKVQCPSVLLHVARPSNQKTYYDKNGILLSAMDEKDAKRADKLLPANTLVDNIKSGHDIHAEKPDIFIQALKDLQKKVKQAQ
ncbi:Hydrolase, alpha/beta fold family [Streptococcus sp. DD11]|uniref:alpha/beta fold hydrolase n=1 Tax=Streptococcus sp. DD11 TaxID=1777879 RepID=UPI000797A21C|nr:alpha/beta hydrolase [Streptococcus sp. DD11]KXT79763.1 Hydrolase, alpha/beta fold family [Streptococcus sp. DD11]